MTMMATMKLECMMERNVNKPELCYRWQYQDAKITGRFWTFDSTLIFKLSMLGEKHPIAKIQRYLHQMQIATRQQMQIAMTRCCC